MDFNINVIEMCTAIPECMTSQKIRHATEDDDHLHVLVNYNMHGWLSTKAGVKELWPYCPF